MNFTDKEEFIAKDLEKSIGFILWEKPDNSSILRIKGIISVVDDEFIYTLQAFFLSYHMIFSKILLELMMCLRCRKAMFNGRN